MSFCTEQEQSKGPASTPLKHSTGCKIIFLHFLLMKGAAKQNPWTTKSLTTTIWVKGSSLVSGLRERPSARPLGRAEQAEPAVQLFTLPHSEDCLTRLISIVTLHKNVLLSMHPGPPLHRQLTWFLPFSSTISRNHILLSVMCLVPSSIASSSHAGRESEQFIPIQFLWPDITLQACQACCQPLLLQLKSPSLLCCSVQGSSSTPKTLSSEGIP